MAERIQLSRRKGWRMPPNTVSVARPTKWGNPFRLGKGFVASAAEAVRFFRIWNLGGAGSRLQAALPELRGKNLACWCPPGQPCHADVLLELANG